MENQLTKLNIFSLKGVQMKTFHITWLMFFCLFFWLVWPRPADAYHPCRAAFNKRTGW